MGNMPDGGIRYMVVESRKLILSTEPNRTTVMQMLYLYSQYYQAPVEDEDTEEVQIALISSRDNVNITDLVSQPPITATVSPSFSDEQWNDGLLQPMILYLRDGELPEDGSAAKKIVTESVLFTLADNILNYVGSKSEEMPRAVVPSSLQQQVMSEYHSGILAGHFSGPRLYKSLMHKWWWKYMYRDALNYAQSCPQCAIVQGAGRKQKPPLHPIPTERPFQIVGVDVMELPITTRGNKYVVVFQDLFTKWPMVNPTPDQKAVRIARLLVEEIVPFFGVPEALLSDRGANLLSHLMKDVCALLGIKKLNTTAHHPECDGAVEHFNRTLKSMLRKQAATHGAQWDQYIHGVLWAYRNTPHTSTGEKPSYLLFGMDCRSPTEAALLPPKSPKITNMSDNREEMVLSLSTARALALKINQKSRQRYKQQHDKKATTPKLNIGEWVLVYFPQDDVGKMRKLSQPWHGPYRVISR